MNITRTVLANIANSTKPVGCAAVKEDKRPFSTKRLAELCEQHNLDPAEIAIKGLGSKNVEEKQKLELAVKLMPYLYPTLKAVEHSGEVKTGLAELLGSLNGSTKNNP